MSLKENDFCHLNQHECKGFYDEEQKYEIKCKPIKCHGKYSHDCGSNICSNHKLKCEVYSRALTELIIMVNDIKSETFN